MPRPLGRSRHNTTGCNKCNVLGAVLPLDVSPGELSSRQSLNDVTVAWDGTYGSSPQVLLVEEVVLLITGTSKRHGDALWFGVHPGHPHFARSIWSIFVRPNDKRKNTRLCDDNGNSSMPLSQNPRNPQILSRRGLILLQAKPQCNIRAAPRMYSTIAGSAGRGETAAVEHDQGLWTICQEVCCHSRSYENEWPYWNNSQLNFARRTRVRAVYFVEAGLDISQKEAHLICSSYKSQVRCTMTGMEGHRKAACIVKKQKKYMQNDPRTVVYYLSTFSCANHKFGEQV